MMPMVSGTAGRRTIRVATRPHRPALPVPARVWLGQNAARPNTASSAGSSVSPAEQHGADADGQRDAELGVDLEGGDEQGQQGGDDGEGGERDGLTDPRDRRTHRVLRIRPATQVLADAEDQEQAVVGARAEHQHDQQQLSELRDLQARVRRLADQRPGDGHGEECRDQRDQRREQRPEDQQQQNQDEQGGHDFDLVPRGARLGLLVDVDGDVAGQVHLQPGWRRGLLDLRAQVVDQRGLPGLVAAADVGQHLQLLGLPVGRPAEVMHRDDGRHRARGRAAGWSARPRPRR